MPDCPKPPCGISDGKGRWSLIYTQPRLSALAAASELLDVARPDRGGEPVDASFAHSSACASLRRRAAPLRPDRTPPAADFGALRRTEDDLVRLGRRSRACSRRVAGGGARPPRPRAGRPARAAPGALARRRDLPTTEPRRRTRRRRRARQIRRPCPARPPRSPLRSRDPATASVASPSASTPPPPCGDELRLGALRPGAHGSG